MANIPLAEIPNAPSPGGAPALENFNAPRDDTYRMVSRSIDEGARSLMVDPRQAAQAWSGVVSIGNNIQSGLKDLSNSAEKFAALKVQQDKLVVAANGAEVQGQLKGFNEQFNQSLDQTKPETWVPARKQFNEQVIQPWFQGLSPDVQRVFGPDIMRAQASGMIQTGFAAHAQDTSNKTATIKDAINDCLQNRDYQGAAAHAEGLASSGAISAVEKRGIDSRIAGQVQTDTLKDKITANPYDLRDQLTTHIQLNPDDHFSYGGMTYDKLTTNELQNFARIASNRANYQNATDLRSVGSLIDNPTTRPSTLAALEQMPEFKGLKDPEAQAAVKSQFLNTYVAGSPDGAQKTADAMAAVKSYNPARDTSFAQYYAIGKQLAEVPQQDRTTLQKELDAAHGNYLKSGGRMPFEHDIVSDIHGQIHQMFENGAFDKRRQFDKESDEYKNEVLRGLSKYQYYVNEWDKISAQNPGNLQEAQQQFQKVIQKDDAKNLIKPKSNTPSFWKNFFQTTPQPQAQPLGKVTSYWPGENGPGDKAASVGSFNDNKLDNNSLSVSPDIAKQFAAAGIKPREWVQLKLQDGSTVLKRYDDHTAENLTGRFDFRTDHGKHPSDGQNVLAFQKMSDV